MSHGDFSNTYSFLTPLLETLLLPIPHYVDSLIFFLSYSIVSPLSPKYFQKHFNIKSNLRVSQEELQLVSNTSLPYVMFLPLVKSQQKTFTPDFDSNNKDHK